MTTYYLGGSPCAGKSTVATLLAMRHGLRVYHCDDVLQEHALSSDPVRTPTLARLGTMGWDAIFLRPLRPMARDALAASAEAFPLVLTAVAALPPGPPVLAEGMALLPECVATLGRAALARAAWLLPTPAFQRAHYARREWAQAIAAGTANPAAAFDNWMRRDELSGRLIRMQLRRLGAEAMRVVSEGDSIEAIAAWVAERLGLTVRR